MCPHCALMHAAHRFRIDRINVWIWTWGIACHSTWSARFIARIVCSRRHDLLLPVAQECPRGVLDIGDRSGHLARKSSVFMLLAVNRAVLHTILSSNLWHPNHHAPTAKSVMLCDATCSVPFIFPVPYPFTFVCEIAYMKFANICVHSI